MTISQLSLTDFRNLKSTTIDFHPDINIIVGDNGSGKTSLLESIYIICQAQSFRTHQLKQCIEHSQNQFLLFARFKDYKAGLSKSVNKFEIRVNGEIVGKRSLLVSKTPINIFNTDTFELIKGTPKERRFYLDWCLFHVEQSYAEIWRLFKHALKQRNSLLKSRKNLNLLSYWDDYLIGPSVDISSLRETYCFLLSKIISNYLVELLPDIQVSFEYQRGWSRELELKEVLDSNRNKDIQLGYTSSGIHRDNIQINVDGLPAAQVLSRGQLKRLCIALQMSALQIVREKSRKTIILLIDDLDSELDFEAQSNVYKSLLNLDLQLFVSNIENRIPAALQKKEYKIFHVEHGMITPRKIG